MKQLMDLAQEILEKGRYKADRTGVGCYSIFGTQMRFNLNDGFPIPTTKKTRFESIVRELLWFIAGQTNIQHPLMEGVPIWDLWAVKEENLKPRYLTLDELLIKYAKEKNCTRHQAMTLYRMDFSLAASEPGHNGDDEVIVRRARKHFCDRLGIKDDCVIRDYDLIGEIGPMYGKKMRDFDGVDQLTNAIELLRTNPGSRRIVVSMWDPKTVPDDALSPEENVLAGNQSLASCHTLFQLFSDELTHNERIVWLEDTHPELANQIYSYKNTDDVIYVVDPLETLLKQYNVPTRRLSLQLYARSQDTPLGTPYNIAEYALLTHLIANDLGMAVGDYIHVGGDQHIYANQVDQVKTWLTRKPKALPKLKLHCPVGTSIYDVKVEDIELIGYDPEPFIKFPVAK